MHTYSFKDSDFTFSSYRIATKIVYLQIILKKEKIKSYKPMEKKFKRTLVTTALPYANGPVHIGHLAGVYVPADIYTRY